MDWNKAANIAVIAAACVVIGLAVKDRIPTPRRLEAKLEARFMGKPLPLPDRSVLGRSVTAVLFVSKSCHFCAESMPFYERLTNARRPGSVSVIAVVPEGRETRDEGVRLLTEHGVSVDGVYALRFIDLGIAATPTIALLDGGGRLRAAWTGLLGTDTQAAVLSRISAMAAGRK